MEETPDLQTSVTLNITHKEILPEMTFGNLSSDIVNEIFKDGRVASHFLEHWIAKNYPLTHISGCKKYDLVDEQYPETQYDEKTFTKGGCKFCPSHMIGTRRKFDQAVFEKKTKNMIFCIVSVVNFPEIKVKFVKGSDLMKKYPKGSIPIKDHDKFFD